MLLNVGEKSNCTEVAFVCLFFGSSLPLWGAAILQHNCRAAGHGVPFIKQHWDATDARLIFANNNHKKIYSFHLMWLHLSLY